MKLHRIKKIGDQIESKLIYKATKAILDGHRTTIAGIRYGACAYSSKGRYYVGFNIFSSTQSLTLHAEQVALVNAAIHKDPLIQAIAISSEDELLIPVPCGICRQALFENARFSKVDILIICIAKKEIKSFYLTELYPNQWPDREPKSRL